MYKDILVNEYKTRFVDGDEPHLLLDVRRADEYEEVRIGGGLNIPVDEVAERADEIEEAADDKPIVIVCQTGVRSVMAAQMLVAVGLDYLEIYNLVTGTKGWMEKQYPIEVR